MFKLFLFFSVFVCFAFSGSAQQIDIKQIDSLSFPKNKYSNFIGVDTHENLFFTHYEVITKISSTQKNTEWVYTNYELGIPSVVSILNPLQILVFYKETNTIILLDRFMNESKRIDLNILAPQKRASWIENTKNKEAWMYNELSNQLEFFNYDTGISLAKSIPFKSQPISITAGFNSTFVTFKDQLCEYSIFGTLIKCANFKDFTNIHKDTNKLIGVYNNKFQLLDKNLKLLGSFDNPKNTLQDFSLRDEKLYIYDNNMILIYQLIIPSK